MARPQYLLPVEIRYGPWGHSAYKSPGKPLRPVKDDAWFHHEEYFASFEIPSQDLVYVHLHYQDTLYLFFLYYRPGKIDAFHAGCNALSQEHIGTPPECKLEIGSETVIFADKCRRR